jgi:hypothetical protein
MSFGSCDGGYSFGFIGTAVQSEKSLRRRVGLLQSRVAEFYGTLVEKRSGNADARKGGKKIILSGEPAPMAAMRFSASAVTEFCRSDKKS